MRKSIRFYAALPVALIAILLGGCSKPLSGSDAAVEWYRSMYSDADIARGCDLLGPSAPGLDWYPGISFGDVTFTLIEMQRGWAQLCPQIAEEAAEEPAAEEPAIEAKPVAEEPASKSEAGELNPADESTVEVDVVRESAGSASSLPYFDSLELWSRSGAVRMLSESVKWSPAWSYGRHLQQGFRAGASAEGGTSVSALGADSVELCIGSRCFAIDDIVVEGGLVYSFSVDGRSIEGSARAWELGEMAFCLDLFDQTCAGSEWSSADLTSIYRFGSSTYVSFELTAGAGFSQGIEFSYAKLLDNDGTHSHTGEVVDVVRAGDTSVWMIVFDAVDVSYVPQIELGVSLPGYGQDASYWFAPEKNS